MQAFVSAGGGVNFAFDNKQVKYKKLIDDNDAIFSLKTGVKVFVLMIVSLLEDCFVTVVLTDLSLAFLLIILTEPPPPAPVF